MPEEVPAAPAPTTTPAAETPAAQPAPSVDRIAAARAKALAKFAKPATPAPAATGENTPPANSPPSDKPPTAEVKGDPESIATIARLSRESRELKAKLAELETAGPSAAKWAEAEKLVKAGKSHKALQVLGADIDKAVQQHLADDPDATVQEAKEATANELLELRKTVEDLRAEIQAPKAAAAATEEQKKLETWAADTFKAGAGKWKTLAKLENVVPEAIAETQAAARLLMFGKDPKKDGNGALIPIREPFTDAEATRLMQSGLDTLEERYANLAKRLNGAPEPHNLGSNESTSTRAPATRQPRPTIDATRAPTAEVAQPGRGKLTAREAQRRALERVGARTRGET